MNKITKKIVVILMAMALACAFSISAFAATTSDHLNKVNGIGRENGGSGSYTSTTTRGCYKITAEGTSNNNSLKVTITVKNASGTQVVSKRIILNGISNTLITYNSNDGLPAGTYTISVVPDDLHIGYEVSTEFYYK